MTLPGQQAEERRGAGRRDKDQQRHEHAADERNKHRFASAAGIGLHGVQAILAPGNRELA